MKNIIKSVLILMSLLSNLVTTQAQANEATIFVLEDDNLQTVVNDIIDHIINNGGYAPEVNELSDFLSMAYANRIYTYEPIHCPEPGLRAFAVNNGFSLRFDNFIQGYPDALFVGQMDVFGNHDPSYAVHGPEGYEGINLSFNTGSNRIFLAGSLCSECTSPIITQCVSKWEVIIIEKSIF